MSCFVKVQGIKTLVEQFYGNGPPTNLEFTVVLAAEDDGHDLMSKAGKIKRISPEEPVTFGFISYSLLKYIPCCPAGATGSFIQTCADPSHV